MTMAREIEGWRGVTSPAGVSDAGSVQPRVRLRVELDARGAMPLRGRMFEVVSGSVWVTSLGDPEDHVFEAGAVIPQALTRTGVATALRPTVLREVRCATAPGQPAGLTTALRRMLGTWRSRSAGADKRAAMSMQGCG